MSTVPAAAGAPARGTLTRMAALSALEVRLLWRTGMLAVAAGLSGAWAVILALVPAAGARAAAPILLFVDTATFGAVFVGALLLFERSDGASLALATSPARPAERLGTRLAVLTAVSVAAAVPIDAAGARGTSALLPAAVGVTLAALLVLVVTYWVALGQQTLTGFLTVVPWILIPLLGVPLAHLIDLVRHPLLYAVPTTGTADWIATGFGPGAGRPATGGSVWALAYALLWVAAGVLATRRRLDATSHAPRAGAAGPGARRAPAAAARSPASGLVLRRGTRSSRTLGSRALAVVRAFARADVRSVRRDSLLSIVVFAPVPLLLAVRFGLPPIERWAEQQHGLGLASERPVILGLLLLLQVPSMFGILGALLVLDDADDRTLLAVRASPVTLERYLAYRVAAVTVLALAGLAVTVPLSGMVPAGSLPAVAPALLVAALVAPLIMLLTTAVASNRVEGVAAMKALGLVVHLPLATWWLSGPWGWPLALIPTYWPLRSLWSGLEGRPAAVTLGTAALGVVASAVAGALLWRRTTARITR